MSSRDQSMEVGDGTDPQAGLSYAAVQVLNARRGAARQLPPPDCVWRRSRLPEWAKGDVDPLERCGAIERVAESVYSDSSTLYGWYRTSAAAWRYVSETLGREEPGPCNHGGVRCLSAGERYECSHDACDAEFGPEVARARLSGDATE